MVPALEAPEDDRVKRRNHLQVVRINFPFSDPRIVEIRVVRKDFLRTPRLASCAGRPKLRRCSGASGLDPVRARPSCEGARLETFFAVPWR